MKKQFLFICTIVALVSCNTNMPEKAKKIEHTTEICGTTLTDNYFWMRLTDAQKTAAQADAQTQDVLDFLNKENTYAKTIMAPYAALQDTLYNDIKSRESDTYISVPYIDNGYTYFTKYDIGDNYPRYFRKANKAGAADELILNVNDLAAGKPFCAVNAFAISPDNTILAYCADFIGRNQFSVYFKDLRTGKLYEDVISNVSPSIEWGNNSSTLYYVTKDPVTLRANKIFRHHLLTKQTNTTVQDECLYEEKDETFWVDLSKSSDKQYIFITAEQTLTDHVLYLSAADNQGNFQEFIPREKDLKYNVDHIGNQFYILTNANSAINYKIMVCNDNLTTKSNWKELIPQTPATYINGFALFNDYIAISQTNNANSTIRIFNLKTKKDCYIQFDEPCYSAYLSANTQTNTKLLRISYTSLSTPLTIYDYNMETGDKILLQQKEVPNYHKNDYIVERITAPARDGKEIPISLIYKKGFTKNSSGKVLLYAYGSYGSPTTASFNSSVFTLLDRGFVYAIAHVRGGTDLGYEWYLDGKLLNKKNTFNDFNDCASFLISQKYTTPDNMFANGGSAGGLLMGAIVNDAPQLYKGIIAAVPFVDVINTMVDETIPLTTFEWDEWGDPRKSNYFHYMLSYSPYDNVKAQNYPNILVTTGFWDSQVQYWEPTKWVAKLRELKTDKNLLLLMCDMESGHGGASGRYKRIEKVAQEYTFILSL